MLALRGLGKDYGTRRAVDALDLDVARRRDRRPARAERRRQDHDDLDGVRRGDADARQRRDRRHLARRRPRGEGSSGWCRRTSRSTRSCRRARTCATSAGSTGSPASALADRWALVARRARADRAREGTGEAVLGRHEAPAQHRGGPRARARAAGPRRADRRCRSAEPQPHLRGRQGAARARHDGRVHEPLHGGGRGAVRSRRDHGRRSLVALGTIAELVAKHAGKGVELEVSGDVEAAAQAARAHATRRA